MLFKSPSQELIKRLKRESTKIICHDEITNRFFMLRNVLEARDCCVAVNNIIKHYGFITYRKYAKQLGIFESDLFSDTDQVAVTGQLLTYSIEVCKGASIYNFFFIS